MQKKGGEPKERAMWGVMPGFRHRATRPNWTVKLIYLFIFRKWTDIFPQCTVTAGLQTSILSDICFLPTVWWEDDNIWEREKAGQSSAWVLNFDMRPQLQSGLTRLKSRCNATIFKIHNLVYDLEIWRVLHIVFFRSQQLLSWIIHQQHMWVSVLSDF